MTLAQAVLIAVQPVFGLVAAQPPQGIAGEYTFQVLSSDDAAADTIASGRFVLGSSPLDLSSLPAELVRRVLEESRWLMPSADAQPNMCFGFDRSRATVHGREFYGGILPAGFSEWRERNGQIWVQVYGSPDAAQYLRGRHTGEGIAGAVEQNNFDGTSHTEWLSFRAKRVGPPTAEGCQAALELGAHASRLKSSGEAAGNVRDGGPKPLQTHRVTNVMESTYCPEKCVKVRPNDGSTSPNSDISRCAAPGGAACHGASRRIMIQRSVASRHGHFAVSAVAARLAS